jgi:hypothetical protein
MVGCRTWARASALLFVASCFVATPASAIWSYISQYQVGIDYTSSYTNVNATYDMNAPGATPTEGCTLLPSGTKQRCDVSMGGGSSSGYGIFLQQAFRKQGFFYFKPDVSFGVRYLSGELSDEESARQEARGLPLESMRFDLLGVVVKPLVTLGITPQSPWPDILLSLGPALQVATGTVSVNDKKEAAAVATTSELLSGFFELEAVFARFGDGALSAFISHDFTGSGRGTKFYPKTVDGMDNIRGKFSRSVGGAFHGAGVKLVLNWP